MKSFSSLAKKYVLQKTFEELGIGEKDRVKWKPCCAQSFLRGILFFLAREEAEGLRIRCSQRELLEIIAYLLIRAFDLEAEVGMTSPREERYTLLLPSGTKKELLSRTAEIPLGGCNRCAVLFVRAAFLCAGTVLDPKKGYHAAFLAPDEEAARALVQVLDALSVQAKTRRVDTGVQVYLKESGKIEDLLSIIGAERFSLELMNQKIERSIRGNINRRQNFDGANLKKTVDGAQNVIRAIRYLEEKGLLDTLPDPLQAAAKLRLSYPEVSLVELCERSEEKLTKSGLNHRLQKMVKISEKIQQEEEEL